MDKNIDWEIIATKLRENGIANHKCPLCQNNQFTLQKNIASILLSNELGKIEIGQHIPTAVIVCNKCGYIEFFALGAFGLINKDV